MTHRLFKGRALTREEDRALWVNCRLRVAKLEAAQHGGMTRYKAQKLKQQLEEAYDRLAPPNWLWSLTRVGSGGAGHKRVAVRVEAA